jgi:threonine aldolase
VRSAVREEDIHEPITRLIAIENTHNACGGTVLPESFMRELRRLSTSFEPHVPVHMDGARIWNALTASGQLPHELSKHVDSLSVCLSKGLGAPIGSVLIGPRHLIEKARRIRKALGGGMRQVGILGAAGLQALDDFESGAVLPDDHRRAKMLAEGVSGMSAGMSAGMSEAAFWVDHPDGRVDTNIVFVRTQGSAHAHALRDALKAEGILISIWSPNLIRMVLHRDVSDADVRRTLEVMFCFIR